MIPLVSFGNIPFRPLADWRNEAACLDESHEMFFPETGNNAKAAKAVCRTCPVIYDCLFHAVRHNERGIWGGTSERERRNFPDKAKMLIRQ